MGDQLEKAARHLTTRCCIVGGGPAGMMLGYLMGRAGVDTLVLEKHADFLRDFRGDTVHPSTMQVMSELGLLDDFLKRPHHKVRKMGGDFSGTSIRMVDFTRLDIAAPFVAFMPQWEFLDFLAEKSAAFPNVKILRKAAVVDLLREGSRVVGVSARDVDGELTIAADLVIGCDGRHSTVRERAGLQVEDIGAPMDVLWFRLGKGGPTPDPALLHAVKGGMLITIDRGDYWQCAYVIPKGEIDHVRARGLPAFKAAVVAIVPGLADHIDDVASWDDVKLLTVTVDRLTKWSLPGLLCIGDAAHAMSPVGGVGINLAIQDAVATANILAEKLRRNAVTEADLEAVRERRLFPTKVTQAIQVLVQNRIVSPALGGGTMTPPLPLRIVGAIPYLQGVLARGIGMGIRPEHVTSPKA